MLETQTRFHGLDPDDAIIEAAARLAAGLDLARARRINQKPHRVNVDFPIWMVEALDREARRLGVARQSVIKIWLAERLERSRAETTSRINS